jgi:hypothetical protein
MKTILAAVSGIVLVAGLASQAFGNITNPLPRAYDFEAYTIGTNQVGEDAWYGGVDALVYATNGTPPKPAGTTYPLESSTHDRVMVFDGNITNLFGTNSTVGLTNVIVDVMVQPGRREDFPSTNLVETCQMAVFVDSNGWLNVWHNTDTNGDYVLDSGAGQWSVLSSNVLDTIGTNEWVRLTITMDYLTDLVGSGYMRFFNVRLNGRPAFTHPLAFVNPDSSGPADGKWFICANNVRDYFSEMGLSGNGMVDDLVVTNDTPSFAPSTVTIVASVTGSGTIEPLGSVVVTNGGWTNFVITANTYYYIVDIRTNYTGYTSASIGAPFDSPRVFVWSNIVADGAINATFAPIMAASNTPHYWLAQYYGNDGTNDATALSDTDGDGHFAWQEHFLGTIPTNAASVTKFQAIETGVGTATLRWFSAYGPQATQLPYQVYSSTNLLVGWQWVSNAATRTPTQNVMTVPATGQPLFYKITVTDD